MENVMAQRVYDSLSGELLGEYRVPGVEDAFAEGKPCERLYRRVLEAYERLRTRLETVDEDADVESIIDDFLAINRIIGLKMYEYGYEHGKLTAKNHSA